MYDYRKMTPAQRSEAVKYRRTQRRPWHSPPHWEYAGETQFLVSAACYEHKAIIGQKPERMTECENELAQVCEKHASALYAWCVLPNHYHILIRTAGVKEFCHALGQMHGRTSFSWNGADNQRGRKVWFRCFDRDITSNRHFWATVNYIHHNPVRHGYTQKWQEWPWSSAAEYLERVGHARALTIWREFPILNYGAKWDVD
jgi:putative transposase